MNAIKTQSPKRKASVIIETSDMVCTLDEFVEHYKRNLSNREIEALKNLKQGKKLMLRNVEIFRLQ